MEGTWQRVKKDCRPHNLEELGSYAYPYKSDCNPFAHLCTPETDVCRRKALRISRFAWHPSKCSLETWNATKLSVNIWRRTVIYTGDSIQVQQFFSLKQMMAPAATNLTDANPDWTHFHTLDGGRFHIAGTQFLVGEGIDKIENQSLSVLPDSHWLQMARTADILVLNHGHHWHRRSKPFLAPLLLPPVSFSCNLMPGIAGPKSHCCWLCCCLSYLIATIHLGAHISDVT